MTILNFLWDYVFIFLFVLTILVFVHELGHYLVARYNNVRVEVFSIGFGAELYGWTDKVGTRWKISAIPLGGYVKMFGEKDAVGWDEDERPMTDAERAVSFHHKRLGQRAAIVAAGPLANFLFAIVVLGALFAAVGTPAPLAGVGSVAEDSAAARAGLQAGDRIHSIDGQPVVWFQELSDIVRMSPEKTLVLDVERNGSRQLFSAVPHRFEVAGPDGVPQTIGRLGVTPDQAQIGYERRDALTAAWLGVERTFGLCWQILAYLGQIINGSQSADQLGGPLRIAQMSGDIAQGSAVNLILFIAAFSINLGLINLFPVPMLDGGHLVFYAVEALRGRPVSERVREYSFRFGLALVMLLMVFATWNDLTHLKFFQFLKQLVT